MTENNGCSAVPLERLVFDRTTSCVAGMTRYGRIVSRKPGSALGGLLSLTDSCCYWRSYSSSFIGAWLGGLRASGRVVRPSAFKKCYIKSGSPFSRRAALPAAGEWRPPCAMSAAKDALFDGRHKTNARHRSGTPDAYAATLDKLRCENAPCGQYAWAVTSAYATGRVVNRR